MTTVRNASAAERIEDFMTDAASLTREVWDGVGARMPGGGASELVTAARDADGGKFLRPRLVAAAFFAYGGTDEALLRRVAAAQQVLHVGLCLHDDVIDGDLVRHGRPTVGAELETAALARGVDASRSARRGTAAGILSGDLAITAAISSLLAAPAPAALRLRLVEALTAALEHTIAGEALDVWSEAESPDRVQTLLIAARKTAAYSVVLPLRLGAIAAGAAADDLAAIAVVGEPLGIAYQLDDDDLGLFGDPADTGKGRLSDLRDGKRTELIRATLERASAADAAVVLSALGDPGLDEDAAARVRAIVEATGARAAVRRTTDDLVARATGAAHDLLPAELAAHLDALVLRLRGRRR